MIPTVRCGHPEPQEISHFTRRGLPPAYAVEEDDFSHFCLISIVATDVKAMITQVCAGCYNPLRTQYLLPAPFRDWCEVDLERSHSHGLPQIETTPAFG